MVFGTPMSWFVYEILSVILFFATAIHAARRAAPTLHVMTLLGFVLYAGVFENIGVWAGTYDYNTHRIMMVGKVPLSILLIEAVIFYAATWLVTHLRIRWWAAPIVIGFLGAYQDLTIDPSNVFDLHVLDGQSSGQWNWAGHIGGLFGIPFFNFSGWMTMMVFFALLIALIVRAAERRNQPRLTDVAPLLAIIPALALLVTINQFLLFAWPLVPRGNSVAEAVMLTINFGVAIFLLIRFSSLNRALSLRRDWVIFAVPVILHLWDIAIAFTHGISQAYLPSLPFGAAHIALLALVVVKGRARAAQLDDAALALELVE